MAITVSPYLHNEELIEEGEENSVDVFHLQNLSRSILILSVGLSYFTTNCIELHLNCKYGCFPRWESSNDFFKGHPNSKCAALLLYRKLF
jgi:hypothetical protein